MDRNAFNAKHFAVPVTSLSARRAWIEMPGNAVDLIPINVVALRKESVDRNLLSSMRRTTAPASLSARRAWIEMIMLKRQLKKLFVALRKESVDRNGGGLSACARGCRRSPQGERG